MIINFKNIIINNFLSFEHAEVKLENCGYTLISGVNNNPDDLARSNGAGKSTINEAIIWALSGDTIRCTKDIVNKFATGGAKVELNFSVDKDSYKLIRTKEDKLLGTNLKIYINGEDKSGKGIRDSEKLLSEYLPDLTSQLVGSVIVLGQGLPQRFSNNSPAGRKEILEKLSKSDFMIEDLKSKLTNRKINLLQELRLIEDNILSNKSKKTILDENLIKLNNEKINLIPLDFDFQIKQITDNINNIQTQINLIDNELNNEKLLLDNNTQNLININEELNNEKYILNQKLDNLLKDNNLNISQINLKINSLKSEIYKLESIKDTCPTCNQKLPNVHKIDTTDLNNQLNEQNNILQQESTVLNNNKNLKSIEETNLTAKYKNKLDSIKQQDQILKNNVDNYNININKFKSDLNLNKFNLQKIEIERDNFNKKSQTIDKDIIDTKNQIKQLDDKILYDDTNKATNNLHLDIVNKMITIASRDFRGFLLGSIIEFIELKAKEYALEMFETNNISFNLDGNNIFIGYNDKQYENLSGGEKQKVDLIIQFSIRDMLSKYLNFSSNILILDEIFDGLDSIGCQKLLNLISKKLLDIESIFIITHHSDISIPYDNEIKIIKGTDNISRLA